MILHAFDKHVQSLFAVTAVRQNVRLVNEQHPTQRLFHRVIGAMRRLPQVTSKQSGLINLEHVTRFMTLNPGDVITTGTPSGVGPLLPGDRMMVKLEGVGTLSNPCIAG